MLFSYNRNEDIEEISVNSVLISSVIHVSLTISHLPVNISGVCSRCSLSLSPSLSLSLSLSLLLLPYVPRPVLPADFVTVAS